MRDALLEGVAVPSPLDIPLLVQEVSQRRGRPIRLIPKSAPLGPCGLWVALPDADVVFYEAGTSRLHREHIILHEVGHLLCAHRPTRRPDAELLHQLLPSLDVTMIQRVMSRSRYSDPEEQEAETMASLIVQRGGGVFRSVPQGPDEGHRTSKDSSAVLDRLCQALGGG
jgi:hypothetical protein